LTQFFPVQNEGHVVAFFLPFASTVQASLSAWLCAASGTSEKDDVASGSK
jgi:hypothetical protein